MQQEFIQPEMPFDNFRGMKEYLLVIQPDDEVYSKVSKEKQCFYEQYRQKVSIKTKPHITVANFMAREEMEETLIRWIQRIGLQHGSFPVTLNNYSGFPPHTVYLRVQDHQPFKRLATQLEVIDTYVRSNGCPPVYLCNRPHMTIARRLPEKVYEKAMVDYSQKTFVETFAACELTLLKRDHQFDGCGVVSRFQLPANNNNLFN